MHNRIISIITNAITYLKGVKNIHIRRLSIIQLIIGVVFVLLSFQISHLISSIEFNKGLGISIGLLVSFITFLNPRIGVIIIIFSMLFSPEIKLGELPGREIVVRLEDILLTVVVMTWLARMAIRKETGLFRKTPLNLPIFIYMSLATISTLRGMILGNIHILKGFFYLLKYLEYFLFFYMTLNLIINKRQLNLYFRAFLIMLFLVSVYGDLQIGKVSRVSAPFEGEKGEPNTFGGYLLFMMSICAGILQYEVSTKLKIILAILILLALPSFMFTLSRASYLGLLPTLFVFILLSPKHLQTLTILFISILVFLIIMPSAVYERIKDTFTPSTYQQIKKFGGIPVGPSPAARLYAWRVLISENLPRYPILGWGVTGGGLVDSQYIRVLIETGLVGIMSFLWIIITLLKIAYRNLKILEEPLYKGITLGFLAGFVGLLFHAIGSNTFIIIRIMEPFWFFSAILILLPLFDKKEEDFFLEVP